MVNFSNNIGKQRLVKSQHLTTLASENISAIRNSKIFNLQKEITYKNERKIRAMGWVCLEINENLIHCHAGATGGYSSFASVDSKNKIGLIILSNLQMNPIKRQHIPDEIGYKIMKELNK